MHSHLVDTRFLWLPGNAVETIVVGLGVLQLRQPDGGPGKNKFLQHKKSESSHAQFFVAFEFEKVLLLTNILLAPSQILLLSVRP